MTQPTTRDLERLAIANLCRYHRKSMPQASHEMFQALPPDSRTAITYLAPLLRIAVALDQSQEGKVQRVASSLTESGVELHLFSEQDLDVEEWHTQKVADVFRSVYQVPVSVRRMP